MCGDKIFRRALGLSRTIRSRRFSALFGTTPAVCSTVWNLLLEKIPQSSRPEHLLWAFLFLKVYAIEHVNCALVQADKKTWRKWVWTVVEAISNLQLVSTSECKSVSELIIF